jgi:hypothetical protein
MDVPRIGVLGSIGDFIVNNRLCVGVSKSFAILIPTHHSIGPISASLQRRVCMLGLATGAVCKIMVATGRVLVMPKLATYFTAASLVFLALSYIRQRRNVELRCTLAEFQRKALQGDVKCARNKIIVLTNVDEATLKAVKQTITKKPDDCFINDLLYSVARRVCNSPTTRVYVDEYRKMIEFSMDVLNISMGQRILHADKLDDMLARPPHCIVLPANTLNQIKVSVESLPSKDSLTIEDLNLILTHEKQRCVVSQEAGEGVQPTITVKLPTPTTSIFDPLARIMVWSAKELTIKPAQA